MKINNNIVYSFLFTLFFISFIFWNRLIRVRSPKDLTHYLELNISSIVIFMLILWFLLLTYYYLLKYLKIIPRDNSRFNKYIIKISEKLVQYSFYNSFILFVNTHIINGPKTTYDYLYEKIYIRPLVSKLQTFAVYKLDSNKELIYLVVFVIIKLIIPITFVMEIIFYKQISIFYKILILLVIPLIIKFLLFFIQNNAIKNIEYFDEFFDFTDEPEKAKLTITYKNLINPEDLIEQKKLDAEYTGSLWFFYQQVYNFVQQIYMLIDKDKYLINVIYYGLFSIGFFFYFLILIDWY